MNSQSILWHDNSRKFMKDSHALFGASKHSWINYSEEKMIELYNNNKAKAIGTELHEMAMLLIKNKTKLPDVQRTLNMYVNDSIQLGLRPEQQLYVSKLFYGTADSIGIVNNVLHIHDLKTGKVKASIHQLEIYAAFFFLEYDMIPNDFRNIELRIYQNDEILTAHPKSDDIVPLMDKIKTVDKIIRNMEENDQWMTTMN